MHDLAHPNLLANCLLSLQFASKEAGVWDACFSLEGSVCHSVFLQSCKQKLIPYNLLIGLCNSRARYRKVVVIRAVTQIHVQPHLYAYVRIALVRRITHIHTSCLLRYQSLHCISTLNVCSLPLRQSTVSLGGWPP